MTLILIKEPRQLNHGPESTVAIINISVPVIWILENKTDDLDYLIKEPKLTINNKFQPQNLTLELNIFLKKKLDIHKNRINSIGAQIKLAKMKNSLIIQKIFIVVGITIFCVTLYVIRKIFFTRGNNEVRYTEGLT